jgi:hypothetical protein
MIQTNLKHTLVGTTLEEPCLGTVLTVWALYGAAIAWLWPPFSSSAWAQTWLWIVAAVVGIGIAVCLREV